MQDWEIEQEMKPIKEKELKERDQLLPRLDFLSARIPKLCYCSLEYWPYQNPTISEVPSLLFNYLKSQRLNNRTT
jgi:hypothetical protein